jgi:hypothetical protein
VDNKKEILYPIGTLVRYKVYPQDTGYIHGFYEGADKLPRVYVIKMFKDGALMHSSEQHLEAIPIESQ